MKFSGSLPEMLFNYVTAKQLAGFKYDKQGRILMRFLNASFLNGYPTLYLSQEAVNAWCAKTPNETDSNHYLRVKVVDSFVHHLLEQGAQASIPELPKYRVSSFVPYILTREQIKRIFEAADALPRAHNSPNKHIVFPLLFRMLYGCGLRVSEALRLRIEDVDLANGVLTILETKGNKDRLVPMHPSLTEYCKKYVAVLHELGNPEDSFFPSPSGTSYSPELAYMVWRTVLHKAGISHGGRGQGPRLHDLRHTYAVHCLQGFMSEKSDPTSVLPYLSAYLGHGGLSSTQDYLRLVPEMYPDIIDLLDQHFGSAKEVQL